MWQGLKITAAAAPPAAAAAAGGGAAAAAADGGRPPGGGQAVAAVAAAVRGAERPARGALQAGGPHRHRAGVPPRRLVGGARRQRLHPRQPPAALPGLGRSSTMQCQFYHACKDH